MGSSDVHGQEYVVVSSINLYYIAWVSFLPQYARRSSAFYEIFERTRDFATYHPESGDFVEVCQRIAVISNTPWADIQNIIFLLRLHRPARQIKIHTSR